MFVREAQPNVVSTCDKLFLLCLEMADIQFIDLEEDVYYVSLFLKPYNLCVLKRPCIQVLQSKFRLRFQR